MSCINSKEFHYMLNRSRTVRKESILTPIASHSSNEYPVESQFVLPNSPLIQKSYEVMERENNDVELFSNILEHEDILMSLNNDNFDSSDDQEEDDYDYVDDFNDNNDLEDFSYTVFLDD